MTRRVRASIAHTMALTVAFTVTFTTALVAVAVVAPTFPATRSASAQIGGTLGLVAQSAFVPSEGTFQATLAWSGPLDPDLTIGGLLYAPISDESEITEPPGAAFSAISYVSIASLPRTADGHLVFDLPIRSVEDGTSDRIRLREAGVYPLQLDVRSVEGTTLATLRTNLIRLPTEAAEIDLLPISTVIEISSAEGLTAVPAAELLTDHQGLPLTVVLGDGVLTQLESDAALADTLRLALDGRPVIAAPSPDLDVSALASIDRGDLYLAAREATFRRVEGLGLVPSTDIAMIDQNLTVSGIDLLADLGVDVILDTGTNRRSTGILAGTDATLRVVQVDSTLTAAMRGPTRSVERVHRLLAALTLRSSTDRSPVFLGGTGLRNVPVQSIQLFLSALQQPGTLGTVDLVVAAAASPLLPIRPDEQPDQNLLVVEDLIRESTADIETYRSFYVNGGLPPIVFEQSLTDALAIGRNPADRGRALAQLAANLDDRFTEIVLPGGQSVTLAAQRAEIPLTVENASDGDRTVLLAFESDKINVTQDLSTVVLPPGVSTIDIELEARSLGRSPLLVRVLTPDGTVELARTRYGVRSTAIPGLGLLLSAAALVFLMSWWIVSIAKHRAQRVHPSNALVANSTSTTPADDDSPDPATTAPPTGTTLGS